MLNHSVSTYAKFSEKLNISYHLIHRPTCVYHGVRNVSFSENLAYVLNEWSQFKYNLCNCYYPIGIYLLYINYNFLKDAEFCWVHNDLAFSKVNDSLALLVETTEQCFVIDSVNAGLLKYSLFFL